MAECRLQVHPLFTPLFTPRVGYRCILLLEDLVEVAAGVRQAIATEIVDFMQSIEGRKVIDKVKGTSPDDEGKQWELTSKLIGDGIYKSCITLGCCQQPPSGWEPAAKKIVSDYGVSHAS